MSQKELKKQELTKLSGILKGLIIYKEETQKLEELMKKYPTEANTIYQKEECFYKFSFYVGPIG